MGGLYIKSNLSTEIKKALGDISKYDAATQQGIRQAVRKGTADTLRETKQRVHVRSGHLLKKITMEYDEAHNRGIVKSKAPHSKLLEKGAKASFAVPRRKKAMKFNGRFIKAAHIPARAARPFMAPAAEKTAPEITKAIKDVIEHD